MDKLTDDVKSLRLDSLFLPGTHDSGAYDTTQNVPIYFEKYIYTQVSLGFCFACNLLLLLTVFIN